MFRLLCLFLLGGIVISDQLHDVSQLRELLRTLDAVEGWDNMQEREIEALPSDVYYRLADCRDEVLRDNDDTMWCSARYTGYGRGPTLKVGPSGVSYEDLLSQFMFGPYERVYVYVRYNTGVVSKWEYDPRPKFVLLTWIGSKVTDEQKTTIAADTAALEEVFYELDYQKTFTDLKDIDYNVMVDMLKTLPDSENEFQ